VHVHYFAEQHLAGALNFDWRANAQHLGEADSKATPGEIDQPGGMDDAFSIRKHRHAHRLIRLDARLASAFHARLIGRNPAKLEGGRKRRLRGEGRRDANLVIRITVATWDAAMFTGLLLDSIYERHTTAPGHPESPERYAAITSALNGAGLTERLQRIPPRAAAEEEVLYCHSRAYLEMVRRDIAHGVRELSTGDTAIGSRSLDVALAAAGGVMNAVDAVMSGSVSNAFCAVRPPGHHATPDRGMGFCIFNNVAIASRYAQKRHGVERVLIADWDVHHGNGTQEIFYSDPSVFFFSTHQHPWYPGTGLADETGEGRGRGATMNFPFPAGTGGDEIAGAFRKHLVPAAARFKPDLVIISAGFDSRINDPLGKFTLEDEDFAQLTCIMLEIADHWAGGRLISVTEGGYNLAGLASATMAHVNVLASKAGVPHGQVGRLQR
jgi:acetoin utilization deacetylase AcuC-like enzyme